MNITQRGPASELTHSGLLRPARRVVESNPPEWSYDACMARRGVGSGFSSRAVDQQDVRRKQANRRRKNRRPRNYKMRDALGHTHFLTHGLQFLGELLAARGKSQ